MNFGSNNPHSGGYNNHNKNKNSQQNKTYHLSSNSWSGVHPSPPHNTQPQKPQTSVPGFGHSPPRNSCSQNNSNLSSPSLSLPSPSPSLPAYGSSYQQQSNPRQFSQQNETRSHSHWPQTDSLSQLPSFPNPHSYQLYTNFNSQNHSTSFPLSFSSGRIFSKAAHSHPGQVHYHPSQPNVCASCNSSCCSSSTCSMATLAYYNIPFSPIPQLYGHNSSHLMSTQHLSHSNRHSNSYTHQNAFPSGYYNQQQFPQQKILDNLSYQTNNETNDTPKDDQMKLKQIDGNGSDKLNKTALESEDSEKEEKKECKICFTKVKNSIFIPCGHFGCCYECASQQSLCPFCRVKVNSVTKVFEC